jgi:hypothetical protein
MNTEETILGLLLDAFGDRDTPHGHFLQTPRALGTLADLLTDTHDPRASDVRIRLVAGLLGYAMHRLDVLHTLAGSDDERISWCLLLPGVPAELDRMRKQDRKRCRRPRSARIGARISRQVAERGIIEFQS